MAYGLYSICCYSTYLSPIKFLKKIAPAGVVAFTTVGVPGTATITATALFAAAGLPVDLVVLLSPISTIADMIRTASNVVGAATASVLTAKTEGLLDENVYNSVNTDKSNSDKFKNVA